MTDPKNPNPNPNQPYHPIPPQSTPQGYYLPPQYPHPVGYYPHGYYPQVNTYPQYPAYPQPYYPAQYPQYAPTPYQPPVESATTPTPISVLPISVPSPIPVASPVTPSTQPATATSEPKYTPLDPNNMPQVSKSELVIPTIDTAKVEELKKQQLEHQRIIQESDINKQLVNVVQDCMKEGLNLSLISELNKFSPADQIKVINANLPALRQARDELSALNNLPRQSTSTISNNPQNKAQRMEYLLKQIADYSARKHEYINHPDREKFALEYENLSREYTALKNESPNGT